MLKRIASLALMSPQPTAPNPALSAVLDGADEQAHDGGSADNVNDAVPSGTEALEAEHEMRLRAEADAQHAAQRLQVAQHQIAEYACSKAAEAESLVSDTHKLDGLLSQVVEALRNSAGCAAEAAPDVSTGALTALAALRERLVESASEASAFSQLQQQSTEADRSKRTSEQAALDEKGSRESDSKRQRSEDASMASDSELEASDEMELENGLSAATGSAQLLERAKYIPLRLSADERRLLRLLEAALSVSSYTDKVDILSYRSKNGRVHQQIKDICAILSGLVVAQDYRKGQRMVTDRNFQDNAQFFQDVFEVGRRFRIMNPDRMRDTYGMLMYLLMDSAEPAIQELLEFECVRPLRTVYSKLEKAGALKMLEEPSALRATAEILANGRSRVEIQRDIKVKERAREALARKYRSSSIGEEELLQCLYSIADNNSFLLFNRDPIDRMLELLKEFFDPNKCPDEASCLSIALGRSGARLSHSHQKQYTFVSQSLTLWREVHEAMFQLWCLADGDLLAGNNRYHLSNTGQGLNRVQAAPRISKSMHNILWRCQQRLGGWVGSAVVHLVRLKVKPGCSALPHLTHTNEGDHNVPNALMFIDKYTQVPRILNPVVLVVDSLPKLCRDAKVAAYVNSIWGDVQTCRKAILQDFFRHAFDGSGADNSFDAGSCIDGRLTSAWNWCSKIEKKEYYTVFRMAGFVSFDGDLGK